MSLHNLPVLKPHGNLFDHSSLIRQWLGAGHAPFHAISMWGGEDLLGRHIRNTVPPISRRCASAQPEVIVAEAGTEIRAGSPEVQRRIALVVQPVGASVQIRIVLSPRGHWIRLVRTRPGFKGVPKRVGDEGRSRWS